MRLLLGSTGRLRKSPLFRLCCGACSGSIEGEREAVQGSSSLEGVGEGSVKSYASDNDRSVPTDNLSMLCWNVAGWARGLERCVNDNDIRAKIIKCYQPDIMGIVETWLKDDEVAYVDVYKWLGHNRLNLS